MNPTIIILFSSCTIVFLLDSLSAIASRRFNFNYARLAPLSFVIYALVGFTGAKFANNMTGVIIAATVGLFDATVGWKISMVLKANTGKFDNNPTISKWISTAIFVTIFAGICGLLGTELLTLLH